jgi:hypothetical protein
MGKNSLGLFTIIASLIRKLSISTLFFACFASPSMAVEVSKAEITITIVKEDKVTVRVKVADPSDRPLVGLDETNFGLIVDGKRLAFNPKNWKSPEDVIPPPAWIIILIDLSGSMNELDVRGTTKIAGALKAVSKFNEILAERSKNAPDILKPRIAIVPFGEPGKDCLGFPVNKDSLDKFFPTGDFKLINYLDFLASLKPCASTNLYEPLSKAVRLLGNKKDIRFYPLEGSGIPQPRLSIILLSDGYHNIPKEEEDFKELTSLLRRNSQIIVHTLGYGLTLDELGKKYKLNRPAKRSDIEENKVKEEEFVDQERLAEIAKQSGGISAFSAGAENVAAKLQLFLNSLLGEYEISYEQPSADRGSKHEVKIVATVGDKTAESSPFFYTISVFGRSLPLEIRLIILGGTIFLIGFGGIIPFYFWAKYLDEEANNG